MQEAESFNRRRTLRSYGMAPWMKLMADRRLGEFLAEKHNYEREARRAMAAMARYCNSGIRKVNAQMNFYYY